MEEQPGILHQETLNGSEIAYQLRGYMSLMSKYANYKAFVPLFYSLACLPPNLADQFVADVRSTYFQVLPHLLRQNAPLDIKLINKFVVASATYGSLEQTLELIRADPVIKEYKVMTVDFCNRKFLSIGDDSAKALIFLKAIIMSIELNNMDALLLEAGQPLETPWQIINSDQFEFCLFNNSLAPPEFAPYFAAVYRLYSALRCYVPHEQFALIAAVYLLIERVSVSLLKFLNVATPDFLFTASELAILYATPNPSDYFEFYDLDGSVGDDRPFDPWVRANGRSDYVEINRVVYGCDEPPHGTSSDPFAIVASKVDDYTEKLRVSRALNQEWDLKSHDHSHLLLTDPAVAVVNKYFLSRVDTKALTFVLSSEASSLAAIPVRHVSVMALGVKLKSFAHDVTNVSDVQEFTESLLAAKGLATLVIDDLALTVDPLTRRSWITSRDNIHKTSRHIKLLRYLMRGDASADRFAIQTAPSVIVWRTVMPNDVYNYNQFNEVITRLDSYYSIRYYPPSRPHEVQFTLFMVRRPEIMTNKFLQGETSRRKINFILRHADLTRRYHGAIYRQLVYDHKVSVLTTKIIGNVFLKAVAESPLINLKMDKLKPEFEVQQKDFNDAEVLNARQSMIEYMGFASGKASSRGKKRAEKDRMNTVMNNIASDVDMYFSNYNGNARAGEFFE